MFQISSLSVVRDLRSLSVVRELRSPNKTFFVEIIV